MVFKFLFGFLSLFILLYLIKCTIVLFYKTALEVYGLYCLSRCFFLITNFQIIKKNICY